jgi:NTP pyrophosphatase (non-canonical NTP hydrolase)
MPLTDHDRGVLDELCGVLNKTQAVIQQVNAEHGWNDKEVNIPEALALIHSEISEALEEYRKDPKLPEYYDGQKPDGFAYEMGDAVIRILHLMERLGMSLGAAIAEKVEYNDTRPYRHGNKTC